MRANATTWTRWIAEITNSTIIPVSQEFFCYAGIILSRHSPAKISYHTVYKGFSVFLDIYLNLPLFSNVFLKPGSIPANILK